jgi:hypothetical protein
VAASGANLPVAGPSRQAATIGARTGNIRTRVFPGGFAGGPPDFASGGSVTPPTGATVRGSGPSTTSQVNAELVAYLEAHTTDGSYLFATTNSMSASPYIIATGKPVMALGGFSGSDPILTVAQLQALIANRTVRYFLLSSGVGGPGGSSSVTSWVTNSCSVVSSSEWGGSGSASSGGQGGGQQLYDCAGKA